MFDSARRMGIVPGFPRGRSLTDPQKREQRPPHDEAHDLEIQARPPHGREYLGTQQEPHQQKRSMARASTASAIAQELSDYGTQLQAKQKLKGYYGNITERQFRRYYDEASRTTGDTGEK